MAISILTNYSICQKNGDIPNKLKLSATNLSLFWLSFAWSNYPWYLCISSVCLVILSFGSLIGENKFSRYLLALKWQHYQSIVSSSSTGILPPTTWSRVMSCWLPTLLQGLRIILLCNCVYSTLQRIPFQIITTTCRVFRPAAVFTKFFSVTEVLQWKKRPFTGWRFSILNVRFIVSVKVV